MRQNATLTSLAEILGKNSDFSFQDPAKISAPFTIVSDLSGNPRKLPDPSKTVKPAMGIERISIPGIVLASDEKGPNGELVWKPSNGETRVRFVGSTWVNNAISSGMGPFVVAGTTGEYIEITFYGTGLNLLEFVGTSRGLVASVDGGAEGANVLPDVNTVLQNRNYATNIPYPVVSGLTLGVHTVRLRKSVSGYGLQPYGFEILNESTQIKVPAGEVMSSGSKFVNPSLQTLEYNSGFDGNPVLNGRGGRVQMYLSKEGRIGKVIQQTNSAQANLENADHANEEVLETINWRSFGRSRADDFSTLSTSAGSRAFTLDDGVTTLIGNNVVSGVAGGNSARATGAGSFITLVFVGTGLDVKVNPNDGNARSTSIIINGTSVGTLAIPANDPAKVHKIVSGLPFGTHVVKFAQTGAFDSLFLTDVITYGPKKPTIPDGAVSIQEYFLTANFVANTVQSNEAIATGVIRKVAAREMRYVGASWSASVNTGAPTNGAVAGIRILGAAAAQTATYIFFGTGFDLRVSTPVAVNTFTISVDGSTNLSSYSTGFYGQITSFVAATGVVTSNGTGQFANGIRVSGLPLGLHTVTITQNAATSYGIEAFDIITPVYFPKTQTGSLSLGPDVSLFDSKQSTGIDLGKAKAWLVYDKPSNQVWASFNIASVVVLGSGSIVATVEKPFKTKNYVVVGMTTHTGGANTTAIMSDVSDAGTNPRKTESSIALFTQTDAGSTVDRLMYAVWFGEQEGE